LIAEIAQIAKIAVAARRDVSVASVSAAVSA
jgi:hypothetical protein